LEPLRRLFKRSDEPPGEADSLRAWACLATNLLVLPGLGSLALGRRTGWLQAGMALGGFALSCVWLFSFLAAWIREQAFPFEAGPDLTLGLLGIGLFGVAWSWSAVSALDAVRQARDRRSGR